MRSTKTEKKERVREELSHWPNQRDLSCLEQPETAHDLRRMCKIIDGCNDLDHTVLELPRRRGVRVVESHCIGHAIACRCHVCDSGVMIDVVEDEQIDALPD